MLSLPRPLSARAPRASLFVLAVTALFALGCAAEPKPAPRLAEAPVAAATAGAAPGDGAARDDGSQIHIDDKILAACGDIPRAHFDFDSATISQGAEGALSALAACFSTGALAGHRMMLVGHADPRGRAAYNMALGHRRAASVAGYIAARGVDASRIATSSRGALDATGNDEDGWAHDRKVDAMLAD